MNRSKLKCEHCKTTGWHVTNDYCKELRVKEKDDKEVAKKIVSKPGRTPGGTPSVSNSEEKDEQEHHGQAVYHFCREAGSPLRNAHHKEQ